MWVYILSVFSSAYLLFLIQPMATKMLLPFLGGTPAVWNTAMMFFQAMLLGGYGYAYLSSRYLGKKSQGYVHVALLLASFAFIPLTFHADMLAFAPEGSPVAWITAVLFLSLSAPFFVLAANAPLMQHWYAHTSYSGAHNPYFLYAASNLGSFLALFAYPVLFESMFPLPDQSDIWSLAYAAFAALSLFCVILTHRHLILHQKEIRPAAGDKVAGKERLWWVFLAFVPSSLTLGLTTYITTDLAAIPLFWIVPLAIYLLTFVLAFSRFSLYNKLTDTHLKLTMVVFLLLLFVHSFAWLLPIHVLLFFAAAMICHGHLAARRPGVVHLNEYYLWIAFGGVLGGIFNAVIAPMLFNSVFEYPLALALAFLARPIRENFVTPYNRYVTLAVCLGLFSLWLASMEMAMPYLRGNREAILSIVRSFASFTNDEDVFRKIIVGINYVFPICIIVASFRYFEKSPIHISILMLGFYLANAVIGNADHSPLLKERNFFGTVRVMEDTETGRRDFVHGTTLHGFQLAQDDDRALSSEIGYYAALRSVFSALRHRHPENLSIAVTGLGMGILSCYGRSQDNVTFFEIDPLVIRIAQDEKYFTYLRDCPPDITISPGDARVSLMREPDSKYDVIILDAYSSDAVPFHLITREAVELYAAKLRKDGVLLFHLSNRHFDLPPVLGAISEDMRLPALIRTEENPTQDLVLGSQWMLLSRSHALRNEVKRDDSLWKDNDRVGPQVWTDDYYHALSILK